MDFIHTRNFLAKEKKSPRLKKKQHFFKKERERKWTNETFFKWRKIHKETSSLTKTPLRDSLLNSLILPLFGPRSPWGQGHLSHLWRRDKVGFTQPGVEESLSPCLSPTSFGFLLPLKKEKEKKPCPYVLSISILFLINPTHNRKAFYNRLAFQLLNESVSRGARRRRNPRGKPEQLTWPRTQPRHVSLLLNFTFQAHFH